MKDTFKITKEQLQGKVPVAVLHVRGWMDAQSEEATLAEAQATFDEGARYLVIDLEEVNTMTSAGIRTLQKIHKLFAAGDDAGSMRIKVCNAPPQVYHVLNITGLLPSIPNYETLQAAVDSF